jgi:hypothetical protein
MNWGKKRLHQGAENFLWIRSSSLDSVIEAACSLVLFEEDTVRKKQPRKVKNGLLESVNKLTD